MSRKVDDMSASPPSDRHAKPSSREAHGAPRWVRISLIAVLVLAVLVITLLLVGGDGHGPGRHAELRTRAATA